MAARIADIDPSGAGVLPNSQWRRPQSSQQNGTTQVRGSKEHEANFR